ncbi:MAG: T9SS type A sorting domain-containing protein, partial [Chloroflexota bacterium]
NLGALQFQLSDSTLYAAGADGDVAFGDYDNDGFADIVLSGNWNSKLYHNNTDGTFTEVFEAGLPALNSPSLAWGDYDNDGDSDLLMVGDDGSITTYVMTNSGGNFTRLETLMEGAVGGSARWGDCDLDGYLDILITGKDWSLAPVSYIYHNNSDDTFSNANSGLVGTALGPADWIDYDNDGDLDIMLSGQNAGCGNSSTILYENDGIGGYTQFTTLNFVERGASAWGDYDNDGDIDLVLTGISGTATRYFYENDLLAGTFQINTPPAVPVITDIFTWQDYGIINWNRSTDQQSPELAITYNMRIGTTPGGIEILSPLSDPLTGTRYQPSSGNMGSNIFCVFKNLQPGTYYFSLQAVDQSFAASVFSEEQNFTILPTSLSGNPNIGPNITIRAESGVLIINSDLDNSELSLINMSGIVIERSTQNSGTAFLKTAQLAKGLYILQISCNGSYFYKKILL